MLVSIYVARARRSYVRSQEFDMIYDSATLTMLRTVLDQMLLSEAFTRQNRYSAVDIAQRILNLASRGERDAQNIERHIRNLLLTQAAA
jgi:hypothetical protein